MPTLWGQTAHISDCEQLFGNSIHFQLWTVVREKFKFYEVEISTTLMGLETPRLHDESFNC